MIQMLQTHITDVQTLVPRDVVYRHPSLSALAEFSFSVFTDPHSTYDSDVTDTISRLITEYTKNFKCCSGIASSKNDEIVVLTGSTGSLGALLLHEVFQRRSVKRIYCFNRRSSESAIDRQIRSCALRGLDVDGLRRAVGSRIVMVDIDLSHPTLGLDTLIYDEVRFFFRYKGGMMTD